ncbi:hypothetical protein CWD56_25545 [Escherichia coli]|nr:hypothetical protein CWD56_25545 [Escherichia coli]
MIRVISGRAVACLFKIQYETRSKSDGIKSWLQHFCVYDIILPHILEYTCAPANRVAFFCVLGSYCMRYTLNHYPKSEEVH